MSAIPFDAVDVIRGQDVTASLFHRQFKLQWSIFYLDVKKFSFFHFTGNNFSSIILTMASSTSLSDLALKSFKSEMAALRNDSLLPNLMNRLIKNLDIKICVLSQTYQRLAILSLNTTYGFFQLIDSVKYFSYISFSSVAYIRQNHKEGGGCCPNQCCVYLWHDLAIM